jgi:hypothetical protein
MENKKTFYAEYNPDRPEYGPTEPEYEPTDNFEPPTSLPYEPVD